MTRAAKPIAEEVFSLLDQVRNCSICVDLPLGPRPILQFDPQAKILIAGQAPGRITHQKGVPFDDPSGNRLREWMGVDQRTFYDPTLVAIMPMGFCFPGTGRGGDLPPRMECALAWRRKLLSYLPKLELTLVVGQYAIEWHFPAEARRNVTDCVRRWPNTWPQIVPLPHPSPRNNRWLKANPWFEENLLPCLRERIQTLIN